MFVPDVYLVPRAHRSRFDLRVGEEGRDCRNGSYETHAGTSQTCLAAQIGYGSFPACQHPRSWSLGDWVHCILHAGLRLPPGCAQCGGEPSKLIYNEHYAANVNKSNNYDIPWPAPKYSTRFPCIWCIGSRMYIRLIQKCGIIRMRWRTSALLPFCA